MQTSNKSIIIIVAAVLVAAFFMPWIKYFVSLSGWDMIFGEAGQYIDTGFKYLALLIPIAGILIIYGAAFNNENYPVPKRLLFALPILTLVIIILTIVVKINESGGRLRSSDLDNIMQVLGIGFWLTLIASIILPNLQNGSTQASKITFSAPLSAMSKIGSLIMLVGVGLFIYSQAGDFKKTKTYDDYDFNKQLGLPDAFNMHMMHQESYIDKEKKNKFMYFGLGTFALGLLVFSAGRSNVNTLGSQMQVTTQTPNENSPSPAISSTELSKTTSQHNLPKVDWNKGFTSTKNFLYKYKIALSIVAVALIAFIVVYNLFIKADPVKDGKLLAKNYCSCSEEMNKNNLASMRSYYDGFNAKHFKSRLEARNTLNNILQENQTKYNNCTQGANVKYTERLADYNAKGGPNAYTFQQTYSSISNACNNTNSSDVVALQSQIDEKIKSIIDPEPDIEKIKSDLIGNKIPGWNFDYLNEFQNCVIDNTTKGNERIEYLISLKLLGSNETIPHDAQINVVYTQTDEGWYINEVKEVFITYIFTAPINDWLKVVMLQGCNYNRLDQGHKYYVQDPCSGQTSEQGPDVSNIPLHCDYIYIKSRDSIPVNITFKYFPAN